MKVILDSKMHIICTIRSKIDYSPELNKNDKIQYKRVGLAPIWKENGEYEFDLFAEMDSDHHIIFHKSLCTKLSSKVLPMAEEGAAKKLTAIFTKWMEGAQRPETAPRHQRQNTAQPTSIASHQAPATNALDAKRQLAHQMAKKLGLNESNIDKMDEARLNDFIEDCKRENALAKTSAKAEEQARAEMVKEAPVK